ncbi:alanine--tRNA ligase, partial [Candidatus Woesearchaeota archaeon]|nr:alanine--tRNA ligase [Candidatus Woesearchaeota archaeon]
MGDKEVKAEFKKTAQKNPERNYPVKALKELGFLRNQCSNCKTYFWCMDKNITFCGDSACVGGFHFIGNSPAKKKLDYIETWKQFAAVHKKMGYTPVQRYPVVARWNPTVDFTIASIAAFQPYVVTGEVEPPANPLVIPQFCLRFNDIDNVGITGSHYVGFIMMGQHAFVAPKQYDINKYITDHLHWLNRGMGLKNRDITIHEDAWAGGGNFGPSMEFFSCGLEISNQVYMQYEIANGKQRDLSIKVLDMGQGHERVPWFTHGESTSYETTFPSVVKKLRSVTGVSVDKDLMKRFLPYAGWLNIDEIENVDATWKKVAEKVGTDVDELREQIQKQAALYSIAEHSRALLFALSDGALPSNVGGGYNLRVVLRRALEFADKYQWDVDVAELCRLHALHLKPLFPELKRNLDDVKKILEVEKSKFENTKQKTHSIIRKVVQEKVDDAVLLQLYDSQGISPELVKEEARKEGVRIAVPENFYARIAEMHEKKEQEHETSKEEKLPLDGVQDTKALYFDDWNVPEKFNATILKVVGNAIALDRTWFYPTSGGQLHDIGYLGSYDVVEVFKQGGVIVHKLGVKPKLKKGDSVVCSIDTERRKQLAQHHTATHIVNAAARKVLGNHINQASAKKTVEKGSIDITHFSKLTDKEIFNIEKEANLIVRSEKNVQKRFIPRGEAEKKFGVGIYQGGVAPGKMLRIVEIVGVDVEACGGTHLNNTKEAEHIHIINTTKVADDVIRLEFVAGKAAHEWEKEMKARSEGIVWLVADKLGITITASPHSMQLAAEVFSVSVEQLHEAVAKFIELVEQNGKKLQEKKKFSSASIDTFCAQLFEHWKEQNKKIELMHDKLARE